MTETQAESRAAERIRKAMARMLKQTPKLANIFNAFVELLAEQAGFEAALSLDEPTDVEIDPVKFSLGVPVFPRHTLSVDRDYLSAAAARLIPAMEHGFPNIVDQLGRINAAIKTADSDLNTGFNRGFPRTDERAEELAREIEVNAPVLKFVLNELLRPYARKKAESISPLPRDLNWSKGYCPVCGSWPIVSFLEGKEGKRTLQCSFCGHAWNYQRLRCPFCESENQERFEQIYAEDRQSERAELCYDCKRYVVSIDLRERVDEVVREVAALGLVHLDALAQEKGFTPGAECGWNVIK